MDSKQFRSLIVRPALSEIGLHSDAAEELLMLTAAQESKLGYYIHQIKGPALGPFQMEPATYNDIWDNYLRFKPELAEKIKRIAGVHTIIPPADMMVYNLKLAAAMARIHYLRVPHSLPTEDDVAGLAKYWKDHYNTYLGAGTPEEAMENYGRYV